MDNTPTLLASVYRTTYLSTSLPVHRVPCEHGHSAEDGRTGFMFLLLRAPLANKASMWMLNAKQRMQRAVADVVEERFQVANACICFSTSPAFDRPNNCIQAATCIPACACIASGSPGIRRMQQPSGEQKAVSPGLAEMSAGRLATLHDRSRDENNSRTHVEA